MNTMNRFQKLMLLLMMLSAFTLNCSKESDVYIVAPAPVASIVEKGWSEYTLGQYESAAFHFESAISQNASYYDAYNGLGWTYFRQGEYEQAVLSFQFLLPLREIEPELTADAYAGLAVIYMTQNRDVDALIAAWEVLDISGESYFFRHDPSITAEDIHILAARCLFNIEEFFLSQREVNAVDAEFPSESLIATTTVVETVTTTDSLEINMSYDSSTPVLFFETEEANVISISSISDTSGFDEIIPYDIIYGNGERGDFFVTASSLPPLGTQFVIEYAYVDNYHDYLIVLAKKIETMVVY
jgi:tetratricopeptide (TPR) repeat protein